MAPGTSTVWSPSESSLQRSSFNALVDQRQADVPEMMMRDSVMGNQAIFGPGWTPSSIMARRLNEQICQGSTLLVSPWKSPGQRQSPISLSSPTSRRERPKATPPAIPGGYHFFRDPAADVPAVGRRRGSLQEHLRKESFGDIDSESNQRELQTPQSPPMLSLFKPTSMESPKMAWGSMLPRNGRQASAPMLQKASASVDPTPRSVLPGYSSHFTSLQSTARPGTAPEGSSAGMRGSRSTTVWRPNEVSLGRSSLNAIVTGAQMNSPQAIQRETSMGRQAMMRPATRG